MSAILNCKLSDICHCQFFCRYPWDIHHPYHSCTSVKTRDCRTTATEECHHYYIYQAMMYYCRVNISAIYSPWSQHGLVLTASHAPCPTPVNIWIWQDDIGMTEHRRLQEAAGHLTTSHQTSAHPLKSQHRDRLHLHSTSVGTCRPARQHCQYSQSHSTQISKNILSTILRRVSSFNDNPLTTD